MFFMLTAWKNMAGITIGVELATMRTGMFFEPHFSVATLLMFAEEQLAATGAEATGWRATAFLEEQQESAFTAAEASTTCAVAFDEQQESPLAHSVFSTLEAATTLASPFDEQQEEAAEHSVLAEASTTLACDLVAQQESAFAVFAAFTTTASDLSPQQDDFAEQSLFSTFAAGTTAGAAGFFARAPRSQQLLSALASVFDT
jgi:hypothetical protein